jgi:dTDP-4-amino-4,6-dideoxygalactose transaminase
MTFDDIKRFEIALAEYTGAPYAIMTDCCTHAIELCLRYDKVRGLKMTPFTYLSIPMTMHKLGIDYVYLDEEEQTWVGEYQFRYTRIWDSARRLEKDMYRDGQMQCLSFGHTKPLHIGHGGAILLDDEAAYNKIIRMRYDGRDLNISPWQDQQEFTIGYHYKPSIEDAVQGLALLEGIREFPVRPQPVTYPNLKNINITE